MLGTGPPKEQRGGSPGNAKNFQLLFILRGHLTVFVRDVYTRQRVCIHVLTMKALLIILPKHLLIEARQCWESEKEREDAAHKGKNHQNKSLMGPLKAWGPRGGFPCFPLGGPGLAGSLWL